MLVYISILLFVLFVISLFIEDKFTIIIVALATLSVIIITFSISQIIGINAEGAEKKVNAYLKEDYILENKEISYYIMEETIVDKLTLKKITFKSGVLLKTSLDDLKNNKEAYNHFDKFINFETYRDSSTYKFVQFDEYPNRIFSIRELYKTKTDGTYEIINEENYITKEFNLIKVNSKN